MLPSDQRHVTPTNEITAVKAHFTWNDQFHLLVPGACAIFEVAFIMKVCSSSLIIDHPSSHVHPVYVDPPTEQATCLLMLSATGTRQLVYLVLGTH